jgi:exodeoxyribonuclease-5
MGIELNNEQIYCIYDLERWWNSKDKQLFQISGSPGTGKTTIIRYFIERLRLKPENVLFVAYMGKAVSVMQRNGLPAKTIHSAIYDYKEKIARDEEGKIILKPNGKPKLIHSFELKDHLSKKIKLIVVDEASMVERKVAEDLMSYEKPVITLGDLNQLPPVFGDPYFLNNPDVVLTQIMRQAEGNPIIWLSQEILKGHPLKYGTYGNSSVIRKADINAFQFKESDIILTGTNRLRFNINNFCREQIKKINHLEYPNIGEKMICRKNNWSQSIDGGIFLTNGTCGFVDYIYRDSFNSKSMRMDFRPDFSKKIFKNVEFDYKHLYETPGNTEEENPFNFYYDKMEFGYAITVHTSQGSSYPNVLYLHEGFMRDPEDNKKLMYTAITRASESCTVVI